MDDNPMVTVSFDVPLSRAKFLSRNGYEEPMAAAMEAVEKYERDHRLRYYVDSSWNVGGRNTSSYVIDRVQNMTVMSIHRTHPDPEGAAKAECERLNNPEPRQMGATLSCGCWVYALPGDATGRPAKCPKHGFSLFSKMNVEEPS